MKPSVIRPTLIAAAVLIASSASYAESMSNVVTTRSDQDIQQQYGRDSVYAFSPDAKPMKPEQTGSRDVFGKVKSYGAEAWHKTEDVGRWTWDHTLGYLFN
jgi:hypothetical protein